MVNFKKNYRHGLFSCIVQDITGDISLVVRTYEFIYQFQLWMSHLLDL